MKHLRNARFASAILVGLLPGACLFAQNVTTKIEKAEVLYIKGEEVFVKLPGGEIKQFEIQDSSRFAIEGRDLSVHELKPGMILTARITTAVTPRWVDTVSVTEIGTVWKTIGSSIIITTPSGEHRMYRVAAEGTATVGGEEKTLDQLHEGDKISARVVKTRAQAEVATATSLVLHSRALTARVGVLLIQKAPKLAEQPGMWGTPEIIFPIVIVLLIATITLFAFLRKRKAVVR
jgi:hypothetical protein